MEHLRKRTRSKDGLACTSILQECMFRQSGVRTLDEERGGVV